MTPCRKSASRLDTPKQPPTLPKTLLSASDQVKFIRQQLQAQDAVVNVQINPRLTFFNPKYGTPTGIAFRVINAGPTLAANIHIKGTVQLKDVNMTQTTRRTLLRLDFDIPRIEGAPAGINGIVPRAIPREFLFVLNRDEGEMINSAKASIVAQGTITYDRQISGPAEMRFCDVYWANFVEDGTGNLTNDGGGSTDCGRFNAMLPHIPQMRADAEKKAQQREAKK